MSPPISPPLPSASTPFDSPPDEADASHSISAASAIAANTFLRSICGGVFPLFATYMFDALHVNWAGTLLACVATVLVPIPIVFWKFGDRIRQRSKFAPTMKAKLVDSDEEKAEKAE